MTNVEYTSDRVSVVRCVRCVYFNDMSDMGRSSFCALHSDYQDDGDVYERLFYTTPEGFCAWGDRCDDSISVNVDNVEAILAWGQ